jgi:TonB family protein
MEIKAYITFLINVCVLNYTYSQVIDCKSIYSQDSLHYLEYISNSVEVPPIPYGNVEIFLDKVAKETSLSDEIGKVYVRFIVDTLGNVHCSEVISSNNKKLESKALNIISNTKFTPAMRKGRQVIASTVLPIIFSNLSKNKNAKK